MGGHCVSHFFNRIKHLQPVDIAPNLRYNVRMINIFIAYATVAILVFALGYFFTCVETPCDDDYNVVLFAAVMAILWPAALLIFLSMLLGYEKFWTKK